MFTTYKARNLNNFTLAKPLSEVPDLSNQISFQTWNFDSAYPAAFLHIDDTPALIKIENKTIMFDAIPSPSQFDPVFPINYDEFTDEEKEGLRTLVDLAYASVPNFEETVPEEPVDGTMDKERLYQKFIVAPGVKSYDKKKKELVMKPVKFKLELERFKEDTGDQKKGAKFAYEKNKITYHKTISMVKVPPGKITYDTYDMAPYAKVNDKINGYFMVKLIIVSGKMYVGLIAHTVMLVPNKPVQFELPSYTNEEKDNESHAVQGPDENDPFFDEPDVDQEMNEDDEILKMRE